MIYQLQSGSHTDGIEIDLPASKSLSNRALILQHLCRQECLISNLSDCDDTNVMRQAFGSEPSGEKNIGAAGTSMRFLTAYYASLAGADVTMTGSERMKQRPISILVDALRSLGAEIEYVEKEGFPPLHICGKSLAGGTLSIDGSVSSQYISAIIMIAPCLQNGLTLQLQGNITSVPYIRMTLAMMSEFGVVSQWEGNTIRIAPQKYESKVYAVESDWSAASYWYELLSLSADVSDIRLKGLKLNSLQGDSNISRFFDELGISTEATSDGVRILKRTEALPDTVTWDLVGQPDLAQTLIATCCALGVHFTISGLHTLRIKETDRISALEAELRKLGYVISDTNDSIMSWDGEMIEPEENPVINTYKDHRMAMALAPLAIKCKALRIDEPGVVSKSYPTFWADLKSFGFNIK